MKPMQKSRINTNIERGISSTANTAEGYWIDAYARYGLSIEDGSLAKLITPAPNKEPIKTSNVISHGVSALKGSVGFKNERTLSLAMHIVASTRQDFLDKYALFCQEVIGGDGYFLLKVSSFPNAVHHFLYIDCQQLSQSWMEMAVFTLSLLEPHPEITNDRIIQNE